MKSLKFLLALLLASCILEPQYSTPRSPISLESTTDTFKIPFTDFFQDDKMRHIIQLAVDNNKDLEIAMLNVETAMETFNVKRADIFPTLSINGTNTIQGVPSAFASFTPKNIYRANISMLAFELDFFGRVRSLKKVAKQNFLATQMAQNVVRSSVISQTANAYLQLIADSNSLEITQSAIANQKRKVEILRHRKENGRALATDILAEEMVLETMIIAMDGYRKVIEQDTHALMLLTGEFDVEKLEPYFKNVAISSVKINEKLLANIPSSVLLQRSDITQAELKLKAANANIGAARAAFFPTISLTAGTFGYASRELSTLMAGQSWAFTPQISIPIFNGGRNRANLNIAKIQKKTEIANYEKAIQTAFREFLDASTNYKFAVNSLEHGESLVTMSEKNQSITAMQQELGTTDSIAVLNATIKLLQAKQVLANQQKERLASVVVVYKTMGFAS